MVNFSSKLIAFQSLQLLMPIAYVYIATFVLLVFVSCTSLLLLLSITNGMKVNSVKYVYNHRESR